VGGEYVVVDAVVVVVVGGGRVGASVSGSGAPQVSSKKDLLFKLHDTVVV
jgi:hypothetical protein